MLNKIDSTSFGGKITITNYKNANNWHKTTLFSTLVEDRLIKLTADSICKAKPEAQSIDSKLAAPFAKLIEMITKEKLNSTEQTKVMTVTDKQVIFADKYPEIDGETVVVDFDKRIDV